MNKQRRKALEMISDKLCEIQVELQYVRDEEEEVHDNVPESLQDTEMYEQQEEAISAMEDADYAIQEAIDYLSEWI